MYLNIGNGKYVREKNIIGIFDMDTATVCVATRNFLSKVQKQGRITIADEDIPKSFLLLDQEEGKSKKYVNKMKKKTKKEIYVTLCKLSSGVLFHRIGNVKENYTVEEENE